MGLLHRLHAGGTTIVLVTHDRQVAGSLPRTVTIEDGRIASDVLTPRAGGRSAPSRRRASRRAPRPRRRPPPAARLRFADALWLGTVGLRARRLRTLLTSLGVAIGISAMVAVVGISASSRADLLAELDRLGTNLLQVAPGSDPFGEEATLPRRRRR